MIPQNEDYTLTTNAPFTIGAGIGHHLNGALSDLRLYKGALNQTDVARLFELGKNEEIPS